MLCNRHIPTNLLRWKTVTCVTDKHCNCLGYWIHCRMSLVIRWTSDIQNEYFSLMFEVSLVASGRSQLLLSQTCGQTLIHFYLSGWMSVQPGHRKYPDKRKCGVHNCCSCGKIKERHSESTICIELGRARWSWQWDWTVGCCPSHVCFNAGRPLPVCSVLSALVGITTKHHIHIH